MQMQMERDKGGKTGYCMAWREIMYVGVLHCGVRVQRLCVDNEDSEREERDNRGWGIMPLFWHFDSRMAMLDDAMGSSATYLFVGCGGLSIVGELLRVLLRLGGRRFGALKRRTEVFLCCRMAGVEV